MGKIVDDAKRQKKLFADVSEDRFVYLTKIILLLPMLFFFIIFIFGCVVTAIGDVDIITSFFIFGIISINFAIVWLQFMLYMYIVRKTYNEKK